LELPILRRQARALGLPVHEVVFLLERWRAMKRRERATARRPR
jgi:hypothetical protein